MNIKPNIYFVGKYKVDGVVNYATLEECFEYIRDKKILGIDIETTRKFYDRKEAKSDVYKGGLDPYLSDVVMLQIGNFEKIYVIDLRDYSDDEMKPIIDFLNYNENLRLIGVNLKFEQKHLKHKYGINFHTIHDCMIQEMCLYNGLPRSYSLAGMAKTYLGVKEVTDFNLFDSKFQFEIGDDVAEDSIVTPFEVADMEFIDKSTRMQFVNIKNRPFTAEQILYGADDILYPLLICERQYAGRRLTNGEVYKPKKLFKLENQAVLALADMELNGVPFDKEKWLDIAKDREVVWNRRLNLINKYIEDNYPEFVEPPNLFNYKQSCKIEWSSPKQVMEFFRHIDHCPKEVSKSTKKLDYTVGAVALLKTLPNEYKEIYFKDGDLEFDIVDGKYVIDNDKITLNYLLFKRAEQSITTFGKDWLKYVHPITGRVHSSFRQILNSGRMASNSPNMQQCPNGVYREAFCYTDKLIIASDYANQEMRTAASLANEEVILHILQHGHPIYGDDLHLSTANEMNKTQHPDADDLPGKGSPEYTAETNKLRSRAKIINFGILYGKEAPGFAEDFGISLEEAEVFIDNYLDAYPKLKRFMEVNQKETLRNCYITINKDLDRRWFSKLFDEMEEYRDKAKELYPPEYFERGVLTKEEKAEVKEQVNFEHPEVRTYWKNFFGIQGSIKRKSTNYKVQGTSADETKLALILMRKDIIEKNLPFKVLLAVHDRHSCRG